MVAPRLTSDIPSPADSVSTQAVADNCALGLLTRSEYKLRI
jgi:hypothetical protein